MRWQGRRQSSHIEDRRGFGGGRGPVRIGGGGIRAGGGGLLIILLVLGASYFLGINPLTVLEGLDGGPSAVDSRQAPNGAPADEAGQFVATVLADTEDTWNRAFATLGKDYREPDLVLFSGSTPSACGFASAATGPFYCPGDQQIYIDLAFYDELRRRFAAPGDFAEAYVIAHEVGHHVQNLLGTLQEVDGVRRTAGEVQSNALSVRLELQADCYAGVYAHDAEAAGFLEVGDIDEALNAASQIGDDAIQRRMQGQIVPETFTHGSSAQRSAWFRRGYESGAPADCDTFRNAEP